MLIFKKPITSHKLNSWADIRYQGSYIEYIQFHCETNSNLYIYSLSEFSKEGNSISLMLLSKSSSEDISRSSGDSKLGFTIFFESVCLLQIAMLSYLISGPLTGRKNFLFFSSFCGYLLCIGKSRIPFFWF